MKKILSIAAIAAASLTASAQGGAADWKSRIGHGQDSINCVENFMLFSDAYKAKNWSEAVAPLKDLLEKAPTARVSLYKQGQYVLQCLLQDNSLTPEQKKEYYDLLMKLYDTRLANMDVLNSFSGPKDQSSKGGIICRKAFDSYFMNPAPDVAKSYAMFKEGINDTGNDTEGFVLYGFIQLSDARFEFNKEKYREDFINDYLLVTDISGRLLQQANEYPTEIVKGDPNSEDSTKWDDQVILSPEALKIIEAYQPAYDNAEKLFVESGAADCDALVKIYTPKVEANKTDINFLNQVLTILNTFECDKSDVYYLASDYAYEITKTPQAAIGKASRLLKDGDENGAIKYFDEAIELEKDPAKQAKYAYIVAALMFKKGNTAGCRQYCKKSLALNPANGGAYLLQASCIARGAVGKSPKAVETSYYYCLAVDYCNRAKAADPSCAAKANRAAAGYSAHYYPKSEAFFAGIKAGQSVSVMGESTTLRLR